MFAKALPNFAQQQASYRSRQQKREQAAGHDCRTPGSARRARRSRDRATPLPRYHALVWRRIPLVPMLFGIFAAWALLSMLASRERSLSEARVYVVTGSFAAIYALLVYLLLPIVPRPK